jgi:predicted MPP superfamily phosphohydrolase
MRIALGSDWHIGITSPKSIRKMLKNAQKESIDVWVLAGDYCGGTDGQHSTRTIFRMVRQAFPNTPILAVVGNHDYWTENANLLSFYRNNSLIIEHAKENNIHFLDEDGIWRKDGVAIIGHTLWYQSPNPPTNDAHWLPKGLEGDTHRFLYKHSYNTLLQQATGFTEEDLTRVVVTHFPIIEVAPKDEQWSGDWRLGKFLQDAYGVELFLNGHSHQNHNGPLRYECGSDYCLPKYKVIEA